MQVSLTPELEQSVLSKVQAGQYDSASDVVREALRLMDDRDEMNAIQREEIRERIAAGAASARAGRVRDGEDFMAQMAAELDAEIRHEERKNAQTAAARP